MALFKKEKDFQNRELACPRDGKAMDKLKHPTGAILDICPRCGGMWLDREEVITLFQAGQRPEKERQTKKKAVGNSGKTTKRRDSKTKGKARKR